MTNSRRPVRPARESHPLPSLRALGGPLVLLATAACQHTGHGPAQDLVREGELAAAPPEVTPAAPTPAGAPALALAAPLASPALASVAAPSVVTTLPASQPRGTKRRPPPVRPHVYLAGRMPAVSHYATPGVNWGP